MRARPLALLAPSELLLPDADLGRLRADRASPRRGAGSPSSRRRSSSYLVLFVTGVPPAEESSLRSRGDAYRRYQRETSVFVPWFAEDARRPPDRVGPRARPAPARRHPRRPARRGCAASAVAGRPRSEAFVERLRGSPIAEQVEKANEQHYEVPPEFFRLVLGPRLKYSSCLWPDGVETLAEAEEAMLALTCERAGVEDGMTLLDLGCGWGSLTGWLVGALSRARGSSPSRTRGRSASGSSRCGCRNVRGRSPRTSTRSSSTSASTASSRSRCSSTCATTRRCWRGSRPGSSRTAASSATSSRTTASRTRTTTAG